MIYIITDHPDKFPPDPSYQLGNKSMVINFLRDNEEVSIDAETRGFDPYTKSLLSLQIGDFDNQYIIDCESIKIDWLKAPLEFRTLIGQNLKFDLKFLYHQGIYPKKIYDTFIVERVLNCGLDHVLANLDALTDRYCQVRLDKSVRVDIPKEGLTPRVIKYAADDIKYLAQIKKAQLLAAVKQELIDVVKLENSFTPCLAYIEYCGFKLDADKWRHKMAKDQENLAKLLQGLNNWVLNHNLQNHIEQQIDLFREREPTVNWSSPKQIIAFFEELGLDCSVTSGGVTKKSVEEPVIKKYAKDHEIVKMYLDFKKAEKLTTTYGENFIEQINPVTGRIHTNFKQILDTGRTSSGGKDKDRGVNLINFQNIPKDKETRACFVSEEGNTLIIADYSGQEQIVLANMSLDSGLLEFYDKKLYSGDMHTFVTTRIWKDLDGLSLEEIKLNHAEKRNKSKQAGFAINYGGDGNTIAGNLSISKEEGVEVYNAYFNAFPELKAYFDTAKQQGLRDGYILISTLTKRKSYLHYYERYAALASRMNQRYWIKYRAEKEQQSDLFFELKKDVKDYFYYKGMIERKALNYPIQGQSAEIVKIATIFIYHWILDNNLFGIVKICNTIHDELVPECPISMADNVAKITKEFMVRAGQFYCKRVPLTTEPDICTFWRK